MFPPFLPNSNFASPSFLYFMALKWEPSDKGWCNFLSAGFKAPFPSAYLPPIPHSCSWSLLLESSNCSLKERNLLPLLFTSNLPLTSGNPVTSLLLFGSQSFCNVLNSRGNEFFPAHLIFSPTFLTLLSTLAFMLIIFDYSLFISFVFPHGLILQSHFLKSFSRFSFKLFLLYWYQLISFRDHIHISKQFYYFFLLNSISC